jgi:hypothetical protein
MSERQKRVKKGKMMKEANKERVIKRANQSINRKVQYL